MKILLQFVFILLLIPSFDVNASPVAPCTLPDTPQIVGDLSFCSGETSTLRVFNPCSGCSYNWSTSAVTDSIVVYLTGTYTVSASNSCGTVSSSASVLVSAGRPYPSISGDVVFCKGQSSPLYVSNPMPDCSYHWTNNVSGDTLYVDTLGIYYVDATNACGTNNSSIYVLGWTVLEELYHVNPCANRNNGEVEMATVGMGLHYTWSNGRTGSTGIIGLGPGTYTLSVTDTAGCLTVDSITLVENPAVYASITTSGNWLVGTGSGGIPPYIYIWDDSLQVDSIPMSGGDHSIVVIDRNGCIDRDTIFKVSSENIGYHQNVIAYPNPSKGKFTFDISGMGAGDITISVTDMTGRKVYEAVEKNSTNSYLSLDFYNLAKGPYIIAMKTNRDSIKQRIVVE